MKPSKLNRHLQVCARLVSEEKQGVDYLKLQLEKMAYIKPDQKEMWSFCLLCNQIIWSKVL